MKTLRYGESYRELPTSNFRGVIHRVIPSDDYLVSDPRSLLYSSGRLGRCNPEGVHCLYSALEGETAQAEFQSWNFSRAKAYHFLAILDCRLLLNLTEPSSWESLGLEERDFFKPFNLRAKRETLPLHELAAAIAAGRVCEETSEGNTPVTGIIFPSNARKQAGDIGFNLVLYREAFEEPDFLEPMTQPRHSAPSNADRWPPLKP